MNSVAKRPGTKVTTADFVANSLGKKMTTVTSLAGVGSRVAPADSVARSPGTKVVNVNFVAHCLVREVTTVTSLAGVDSRVAPANSVARSPGTKVATANCVAKICKTPTNFVAGLGPKLTTMNSIAEVGSRFTPELRGERFRKEGGGNELSGWGWQECGRR